MNKLAAYKKSTGQTQAQLAEAFGVDRAHLSKIINGRAYPSRKLMERIEAETNGLVPVTSWFSSAEGSAA